MAEQQKIEYSQLEAGYTFPPASYDLAPAMVSKYIKAVGETSSLYQGTDLVPPTAIAAYALAVLSEGISLPDGSIHVSQGLEFLGTLNIGDTITCRAEVSQKKERRRMHLLNIDLTVFDQRARLVMKGKTSFILPESD
ncbi:MAG: hypothetical protein COS88_04445 [Chloroflexi bacterium CG07_land_8_20_14_0_80_51_10]|nr:MAG: hypothetical protein COS88_04445 [Chloroflexi bacterium CG07_land_8_20_14_0_80_51_10]